MTCSAMSVASWKRGWGRARLAPCAAPLPARCPAGHAARAQAHGASPCAEPAAPLPLEMHVFDGKAGWQPSLVYRGERWDATRLAEFGALLVDRGVMTPEAGDALAWVSEEVLDAGTLHLAGRKIAVLGGGAEMAPTRFWLEQFRQLAVVCPDRSGV